MELVVKRSGYWWRLLPLANGVEGVVKHKKELNSHVCLQNEGRKGIGEHTICINADKYTEVDGDSIPTGKVHASCQTD